MNVLLPASVIDALASQPWLAVLALALLAVAVAICSEADAFVAASMPVSPMAQLAFLVVGPAVDVKLISLQAGTFGREFASRFAPVTFRRCGGVCRPFRGVGAVRRDAQAVVLVLVGVALIRVALDGTYLLYVKEAMGIPVAAAGAVLVLLGGLSLWRDRFDEESAHEHHEEPRVAWLLMLPVLSLFLIAPPALGADAASRDSGVVAKPPTVDLPALRLDDGELPLPEYAVRATWDAGRTLEGRQVTLVGFVTTRPEGGWYLTRMQLSCCAADGQAVKVEVRGLDAPPVDTWVAVTGTYEPVGDGVDPRTVPAVIRATSLVRVEQPRNPYA